MPVRINVWAGTNVLHLVLREGLIVERLRGGVVSQVAGEGGGNNVDWDW